MTTSNHNYQLQGSYTRYHDGLHAGYDSIYGPSKRRNFATMENALRAAKKELKRNNKPYAATYVPTYDDRNLPTFEEVYAADGTKLNLGDDYEWWHVDGLRIVDRETQRVLWEA